MKAVFPKRLLGLLAVPALLLAPLGCGSEQSKMDRGVVVDREEAVPGSAADFDMTEAERRAKEEAEVEKKEAAAMEESQ
jgi:hypothetical protein